MTEVEKPEACAPAAARGSARARAEIHVGVEDPFVPRARRTRRCCWPTGRARGGRCAAGRPRLRGGLEPARDLPGHVRFHTSTPRQPGGAAQPRVSSSGCCSSPLRPFQARLTRWAATTCRSRLARVEPPLAGRADHADQHLGVHRRGLRVEPAALERVHEDPLDPRRHVADDRLERRRGADRAVPDQDPEAVGVLLDVVQQRDRGLLEQLARTYRPSTPPASSRAAGSTSRSTTTV